MWLLKKGKWKVREGVDVVREGWCRGFLSCRKGLILEKMFVGGRVSMWGVGKCDLYI